MPLDSDRFSVRLLDAARREARAVAKLALLLPRDGGPPVPSEAVPGDDVVVLVHGTLATAGAWQPVRERLSRLERSHSVAFTYGPGSGVERVAAVLAAVVGGLPPLVRVHLVGHSLGGLAVRWFVQETASDARVVQTITVAAPFEGARGARFFPGPAGRDMRRGSPTLARLAKTARTPSLSHLSIFGSADTTVPAETAFPAGDRETITGAGHNALLFDPRVVNRIVERVSSLRSGVT